MRSLSAPPVNVARRAARYALAVLPVAGLLAVSLAAAPPDSSQAPADSLRDPREVHLARVRQLTFGGENAEAYFSFDGSKLVFQSTRGGYPCDQIYTMNVDGSGVARVSNGTGRTTCGYWLPSGDRLLFSSTHLAGEACPRKPDYSKGYVWPLYPSYDIFTVRADGKDLRRLTYAPGYDAEAVVSPDGSHIVFTSTRSGDPEIYAMRTNGSYLHRLTRAKGYDGGAWWSPDGEWIVYRAYHPETPVEIADYDSLMARHLIRPTKLELWLMRADGRDQRQLTTLGAASFCPTWLDARRILFASNVGDPNGRNFDLYVVDTDGTGLERVTYNDTFDAFPMMSPDGRTIVWGSNRASAATHETNIFVADWVEAPARR